MDRAWAIERLEELESAAKAYQFDMNTRDASPTRTEQIRSDSFARLSAAAAIAERILDRIDPRLADELRSHSAPQNRQAVAAKGRAVLEREEELAEKLGLTGPQIAADDLHPWVWSAASTLWNDGHHSEAVSAAAETLRQHVQAKTGRNDISGPDLFRQVYSDADPKPENPRLRPPADVTKEGSETYRSLISGARDFGAGAYALIRNLATHERNMTEQEAVEALAALSFLARRVEQDELRTADK